MNGSDEAGRIRDESAGTGPGARFTFTLPAAAGRAATWMDADAPDACTGATGSARLKGGNPDHRIVHRSRDRPLRLSEASVPVPTKPSRLRRVNLHTAGPETGFFNKPLKGGVVLFSLVC